MSPLEHPVAAALLATVLTPVVLFVGFLVAEKYHTAARNRRNRDRGYVRP